MWSKTLPVLLHTFVVAVSLGVAWVLIKLLGIDSPTVAGVIALVVIALEKLIREISGTDYVNK